METPRPVLPPLVFSAPFAVLSTLDADGYPDARAMLNLRNERLYPHLADLYRQDENPMAVYLTTNTSSEKSAQIAACPRACLYFFDGDGYAGVSLRGKVQIVADREFKRRAWAPGWEEYYPGGADSQDFTMLRFVPERIKSYADLSVVKTVLGESCALQ